MSLSIKFPLYGEGLLKGPYNVSLSFPGIDSIISKSIGINEKSALLIPNVNYITQFVEGNLGITDGIFKSMIFKNLSDPRSVKSEDIFKDFSKNTGTDVGDIEKLKDKKGKIRVKQSDIKFELPEDIGLKSFETIFLKSIFETQKPYMEVASIIIDSLVSVEDVIARLAPLLSISPLTTKSKKPRVNGGNGSNPKALGFSGGDTRKRLEDLKNLINQTNQNSDLESNITNSDIGNSNKNRYEIISTVYSTGDFDPTVDYKYVYIDLPPNSVKNKIKLEEDTLEDIFDKYKPKTLIFGIYDSNGILIDPNEKLKAKVIRNGRTETVDTPYKKAGWILESEKWKLGNDKVEWPCFSEPYYVWKRGGSEKISKTPIKGYELKRYKSGDKNILTNQIAIEGNPIISRFENSDLSDYLNYFKTDISFGLYESKLPVEEQNKIRSELIDSLDIKTQLENTLLYGQISNNSIYKGSKKFPDLMRKVFKPYQIHSTEAESDPILKDYYALTGERPGMIWVNPETDYSLKVIKVVPATTIELNSDSKESVKEIKTVTLIRNNSVFKFNDDKEFNVKIINQTNNNINEFTTNRFELKNWNYPVETNQLNNGESYSIEIYGNDPIYFFKSNIDYSWKFGNIKSNIIKLNNDYFYNESVEENGSVRKLTTNGIYDLDNKGKVLVKNNRVIKWIYYSSILDINNLPNLNQEKTFTIDSKQLTVSETTIEIPSYFSDITNNSVNGSIIDKNPYRLNKRLTSSTRFSNSKYGHGSSEEPQEVDTIKRFMLSEEDNETYYIVEGVLNSEYEKDIDTNQNKNKSNNNDWYKIKDALGVFKVFIKLIIKIASKLLPEIVELIDLFTDPAKFVTDILIRKVKEYFGPLSSESIKKLKLALETSKDKFKTNREYVRSKQKHINESRLKNYVYIDKTTGVLKTLLDGSALIPFSLFGKDLSFGLDLKMSDVLTRVPVKLIVPDFDIKSLKENLQKLRPPFKSKTNSNNLITSLSNGSLSTESALKKLDQSYPFNDQFNVREEIVNIRYSTGEYIPGVDYNYIYVTEDVKLLIDQSDELVKKGDDSSLLKANELLDKAIDLDPKNNYIKTKKKSLLELLKKLGLTTQPFLKMLLGLTTLPIKIVAGVVKWIFDFFKSLVNPFTLPAKIVELLSFKWILDFFTPKSILNMAGIKFDPLLIKIIREQAFAKKANGEWLFPDKAEITNIGDIMSIQFLGKIPTYTYGMIRTSPNILTLFLKPVLCFIEKVINGIINFIWSILGIEAIIKAPQIKLCSDDLSPEDLSKAINNDNVEDLLNDSTDSTEGDGGVSERFVYEVKLPNGEIVRKANLEELNQFIEENKQFNYEKNF